MFGITKTFERQETKWISREEKTTTQLTLESNWKFLHILKLGLSWAFIKFIILLFKGIFTIHIFTGKSFITERPFWKIIGELEIPKFLTEMLHSHRHIWQSHTLFLVELTDFFILGKRLEKKRQHKTKVRVQLFWILISYNFDFCSRSKSRWLKIGFCLSFN